MNVRRDALAAAAKLALEIRAIAGKHPDAVCTMGSLKTFPGLLLPSWGAARQRSISAIWTPASCGNVSGSARSERAVRR